MNRFIQIAALLAAFLPLAAQAAPAATAHAELVAAMDRAYNLSFPVPHTQLTNEQKAQVTRTHAQHES